MTEQRTRNELWEAVLDAERSLYDARTKLIADGSSLHRDLDQALNDPAQRGAALRLLQVLDEPTRREYLPRLVELASVGHANVSLVRDVILSLDRAWVKSTIWQHMVDVLGANATEEEYRRFAELLRSVDPRLLDKLVQLAMRSEDDDIREVGEDFLPYTGRSRSTAVKRSSRKAVQRRAKA